MTGAGIYLPGIGTWHRAPQEVDRKWTFSWMVDHNLDPPGRGRQVEGLEEMFAASKVVGFAYEGPEGGPPRKDFVDVPGSRVRHSVSFAVDSGLLASQLMSLASDTARVKVLTC